MAERPVLVCQHVRLPTMGSTAHPRCHRDMIVGSTVANLLAEPALVTGARLALAEDATVP